MSAPAGSGGVADMLALSNLVKSAVQGKKSRPRKRGKRKMKVKRTRASTPYRYRAGKNGKLYKVAKRGAVKYVDELTGRKKFTWVTSGADHDMTGLDRW